jgi:hypothetical protein
MQNFTKVSYRISPISDSKHGKYGWEFIYTLKKIAASAAPIFTKIVITQDNVVDIFYMEI